MSARFNKSRFEELCNNFHVGQFKVFLDFIQQIKLLNIPLKEWITLDYFAIYWTHILKRSCTTPLDRLDIDIIDWHIQQKLVDKVKSPNFTSQVLLDFIAENPLLSNESMPSTDAARDSTRRKVLRFVAHAYDAFITSITGTKNPNSSDIFALKPSAKRGIMEDTQNIQDGCQPSSKKTTVRGSSEPELLLTSTIIELSNHLHSSTSETTRTVANIIEEQTTEENLHRQMGARIIYAAYRNKGLSEDSLTLTSVTSVTQEEVQSLYDTNAPFRTYMQRWKKSVQNKMIKTVITKKNIEDKQNIELLKRLLLARDGGVRPINSAMNSEK